MTERPYHCPRDGSCPSDRHDTHPRAYRGGCRSGATYAAVARRARERYHGRAPRMVDATGAVRRIQALAALGWTYLELAERLYVTVAAVHRRASRPPKTVHPDTAAAFGALYLELSEVPPPDDWVHQRAARRARANGYEPPEAWDGLDIDDPKAKPWTGDTALALADDVAFLRDLGLSARDSATRLGLSQRQVERIRGQLTKARNAAPAQNSDEEAA